jgi:hypothetical protein
MFIVQSCFVDFNLTCPLATSRRRRYFQYYLCRTRTDHSTTICVPLGAIRYILQQFSSNRETKKDCCTTATLPGPRDGTRTGHSTTLFVSLGHATHFKAFLLIERTDVLYIHHHSSCAKCFICTALFVCFICKRRCHSTHFMSHWIMRHTPQRMSSHRNTKTNRCTSIQKGTTLTMDSTTPITISLYPQPPHQVTSPPRPWR